MVEPHTEMAMSGKALHASCKELMITDVQLVLGDTKASTVKGVHLGILVIQVFQEAPVRNVSVILMDPCP
ncbi:unnamed protein product [Ranitomeya imitator]|uniref:Uncharacterized protein n=1 Tax=Ranitomeya imitator TaxID=111125 RepID=A0ABN9KUU0_9NEOB|nr:unnamed protein product [Ranitomeya imitator]